MLDTGDSVGGVLTEKLQNYANNNDEAHALLRSVTESDDAKDERTSSVR